MTQDTTFKLLDKDEIAKRRVPLEEAEIQTARHKGHWLCNFCEKRFQNETFYMKHRCEQRKRHNELKTPLGQAAFGYYREWMTLKKFSAPSSSAFLESKYYRSFMNFAQLVVDANISRPDRFMELMVEADVLPILWCREQCYAVYLEWMDKLSDPLDQVQESINYLMDLAEKDGVELNKIYEHLGAQKVLSLVRQRRLTPWLLFCSPSFGKFLRSMDEAQLKVFNIIVNAQYWGNRFQQERATIENIKMIVKEVHL